LLASSFALPRGVLLGVARRVSPRHAAGGIVPRPRGRGFISPAVRSRPSGLEGRGTREFLWKHFTRTGGFFHVSSGIATSV